MGLEVNKNYVEIERRFFVNLDGAQPWRNDEGASQISQFYLRSNEVTESGGLLSYMGVSRFQKLEDSELELFRSESDWIARLRLVDDRAVFTLKGRRTNASAHELEWELPLNIGHQIGATDAYPSVRKRRHEWRGADGLLWEVDEFEDELAGLILAEVELPDENHPVELPLWLGLEITGDRSWSNAQLAHAGRPVKQA
jgi:CYTH domain-containing protein